MELTTLSWVLLAADRAGGIGVFFFFFLIIFATGIITRAAVIHDDMGEGREFYGSKLVPRWAVYTLVLLSIPFLLALVVPSHTVIMQVAAIELGEDVLNSDEFKRILSTFYIPKEN